jgi:hypothetical protein
MRKIGQLIGMSLLATSALLFSTNSFAAESATLHPITWKGKKWEYLVEYPTGILHVDPVRFEELLDTAGQHGWRLVDVSGTNHFYAFYFERPLHADRIEKHRARIQKVRTKRINKETEQMKQILAIHKQNQKFYAKNAEGIANVDRLLVKENKALKELAEIEKQELAAQEKANALAKAQKLAAKSSQK